MQQTEACHHAGICEDVAAIINLARSDRRLAATIEQRDTDQWLLNTPAGTIDLRTGRLRAHRASDYITKITAMAPDRKCPIPLWLAFLDRVTSKDVELIAFLQRMSGYSLTGSIQENALFFFHGTGANGKRTLVNVLTGILGDYHNTAPIETFTASHTDHHPTDLAGLRGARLVTSIETEEGRRWAENKIKALTGGDKIAARFMRQDFFHFIRFCRSISVPLFCRVRRGSGGGAPRSILDFGRCDLKKRRP